MVDGHKTWAFYVHKCNLLLYLIEIWEIEQKLGVGR